MVFFYPKANTPGCTNQACGLRDVAEQIGDTVIVGISPDMPDKLDSFDDEAFAGVHSAERPRTRRGREIRGLGREEALRQDLHGDHPQRLPHRREGQGRTGLVQGQPQGHRKKLLAALAEPDRLWPTWARRTVSQAPSRLASSSARRASNSRSAELIAIWRPTTAAMHGQHDDRQPSSQVAGALLGCGVFAHVPTIPELSDRTR